MKSKKTMLILPVAVVALCAVALIGAGFAIQYTGVTSSTGNNVNSTYITVGSTSYTDTFDHEIYYNTTTTPNQEGGITTTYELNTSGSDYKTDINGNLKGVLLGTVKLTIIEKPLANGEYDGFNITITHDNEIKGEYYIGYKIGDNGQTKYISLGSEARSSCTTETINGNASTDIYIDLYIVNITAEPTEAPTNPVNDVIFTFTATAGTA